MVEPKSRSGSDLEKSFAYFQKILQQSVPIASASYGLLASVLIFTFLGESAEAALLWHGHINPIILLFGVYLFWIGLKQIKIIKVV